MRTPAPFYRRAAIAAASTLALTAGLAVPPPATADDAAWQALAKVRRSLVAGGPVETPFEQTYVPAGFASGDAPESGRLAMALPECLRWDYSEPYPKSFLICGDYVFFWNEEDGTGRRQAIDRENEPGLDLLLLDVDELRRRYSATATADGAGATPAVTTVELDPIADLVELQHARLTLDTAAGRVLALEYRDVEGNLTRFTLGTLEPLASTDLFSPPTDIEWHEEEATP